MTDRAVIQGTYADYRRVKGRKVLQLVVEVPIEQAPQVHQIFGEPSPDGSTWVAVALLDPAKARAMPSQPSEKPASGGNGGGADRRRFTELPNSTQAALACKKISFRRWLSELHGGAAVIVGAEGDEPDAIASADRFLKLQLGINSKAQLDTEPEARENWPQFYAEFHDWLNDPEAA